ncbi:MAG TPA: phosphopantetheine-binding protein [Noviherbaspirillum sp.]
MNNPFTPAEMVTTVTDVLATVLGLTPEEISEDSAIADDLGADSLDFVDLNATLEKRLNIALAKKGALGHAEKISGRQDLFYNAKTGLTAEGVELLKNSLSQYTQLQTGMTVHDIFNLTTVKNVANLCHALFDYLPSACPECGHQEAKLSAAGKVVCGGCSAGLRPVHGDEAQVLSISQYLQEKSLKAA